MAGYAKVFSSIADSSIWTMDHKVLRVWIYLLVKCDSTGILEGSIPGLAHNCLMSREDLEWVMGILQAPDPDSRTPDNEGRRVEVVPGGWKVLNYHLYRDRGQGKEGSRAPYMRTYREQKKNPPQDPPAPAVVPPSPDPLPEPPADSHALPPSVTRDTNANANAVPLNPAAQSSGEAQAPAYHSHRQDLLQLGRDLVLKIWAEVAVPAGLPAVLKLDARRQKALDARLKDPLWLPRFQKAVVYAATHPEAAWMRGQGERPWRCNLDYLLKDGKVEKHTAEAQAAERKGPARASPGGMAADAATRAQVQKIQVPQLKASGGAL